MISVDTTEGRMEIDFEKMELYKLKGDLCCPMVDVTVITPRWIATDPLGAEYYVTRSVTACKSGYQKFIIGRVGSAGPAIGQSKEVRC